MIKSIAKHRYFKGQTATKSVKQYIAYVAYRGGVDSKVNGRVFFDDQANDIKAARVKDMLAHEPTPGQSVLAHEIVLSPGIQTVDAARYTRTLMNKLGTSIGRDLNWVAVEHKGAHNHIHVLIDAKDKTGRRVLFRTEEYRRLREWGDQYLERQHGLERFLSKEVDLNAPFIREKGDKIYERLFEADEEQSFEVGRQNYFKLWSKEKAIAELPDEEKVYIKGKAFHQYSTSKELWAVLAYNRGKLSQLELKNIEKWIADKRDFGDDHQERLARESFARKNISRRRRNTKHEDKDNSLKRGEQSTSIPSKSGSKHLEAVNDLHRDKNDDDLAEKDSLADATDFEKAQLQMREDERIAQIKRETNDQSIEIHGHVNLDYDADLADLDLSIIEFDRDFHDEHDFEQVVKRQVQQKELERQKVDLKIEQEQGTLLAQKDNLESSKWVSGAWKGKLGQFKHSMPKLKRDFRDQNRSNKWMVQVRKPSESHSEEAERDRHLEQIGGLEQRPPADRTSAADMSASRALIEEPLSVELSRGAQESERETDLDDLLFSKNDRNDRQPAETSGRSALFNPDSEKKTEQRRDEIER